MIAPSADALLVAVVLVTLAAIVASLAPWSRVRDVALYVAVGILAGPLGAAVAEPSPRGERMLARYAALDRLLVGKGFPATSPWWLETIARFYASTARQLVLRVGRRGGKSSTLCRIAVVEALWGGHVIPPGDVGVVAIVSVRVDEGQQRLRTIKAILDALGVGWRPIEGGIELRDRAIAVKVYSASIAGVSGFTCICAIGDEAAKWNDSDTGQNPATEVLASLRPTMATQPHARLFLSSSPMGTEDAHAKAFDLGETTFQLVAYAPTWVANPSVTEAETRALEVHDPTWSREYLAIPSAGGLGAFDVEALRACVRHMHPESFEIDGAEIVIDSSGGKNDTFVICVFVFIVEPSGEEEQVMLPAYDARTGEITSRHAVVARDEHGQIVPNARWHPPAVRLLLAELRAFEGPIAKHMTTGAVADVIVEMARAHRATRVHGDQFGSWSWSSDLNARGLLFEEHPWSSPTKTDAVLRLRQMIREGTLVISPTLGAEADKLISEARTFVETITPSGALSFGARGRAHDDRLMTLLLAARVDTEGRLRGSPLRRSRERIDWEASDNFME